MDGIFANVLQEDDFLFIIGQGHVFVGRSRFIQTFAILIFKIKPSEAKIDMMMMVVNGDDGEWWWCWWCLMVNGDDGGDDDGVWY